jgi:hypothetical protein
MPLTKGFKELVQGRVANDPAFAAALLREGIDTMLTGDVDAGKVSRSASRAPRYLNREMISGRLFPRYSLGRR